MSSADMNHPSNSGVWPDDPYGDLSPILEASVEAAKQRHPSGKGDTFAPVEADADTDGIAHDLTAADRCDNDCGAGALYRLKLRNMELVFCHHHHAKHFPTMEPWGWKVVGVNDILLAELYREHR